MSDTRTSSAQAQVFPPTRWSVVLAVQRRSGPEADAALEAICRTYWYPLYAFVRRSRRAPHDAQDITQEFFRQLLEKRWLEDADSDKGRLRTFLITALKRFLANEWRRASTQRRGGGQPQVPIDTTATQRPSLRTPKRSTWPTSTPSSPPRAAWRHHSGKFRDRRYELEASNSAEVSITNNERTNRNSTSSFSRGHALTSIYEADNLVLVRLLGLGQRH
jgi:DNA-directed RNA polymerase specialized sigma24 family protein